MHDGLRRFVQHLNWLYVHEPAYYELDDSSEGFEWIDSNDSDNTVWSFMRKGRNQSLVFVVNATPVVRGGYRLGVSAPGFYEEILNTDAEPMAAAMSAIGGGAMRRIGAGRTNPIPSWSISRRFPSQASNCALLLPKGLPLLPGTLDISESTSQDLHGA